MLFSNAKIYTLKDFEIDAGQIHDALVQLPPTDPTGHQLSKIGWPSPFGGVSTVPVMALNFGANQAMMLICRESYRDLPAAVVKEEVNKRAAKTAMDEDRRLGRKELMELQETVVYELLPKAFIKHRNTAILIADNWVLVDASSSAQADNVLSQLRSALGSFPAVPALPSNSVPDVVTPWLKDAIPADFEYGTDLHLTGSTGDTVKFSRFAFDHNDEVATHLEAGKKVTLIGLTAKEASFTIDENLTLRKIKPTDVMLEMLDDIETEDERALLSATCLVMAKMLISTVKHLNNELHFFGDESDAHTTSH